MSKGSDSIRRGLSEAMAYAKGRLQPRRIACMCPKPSTFPPRRQSLWRRRTARKPNIGAHFAPEAATTPTATAVTCATPASAERA
jgi:hypothetical protein